MKMLKNIFLKFFAFFILLSIHPSILAKDKITITQLIQSSRGLGGKKISYPRWKDAELRLLKVNIPVGLKTPIHTHPAPMLIYVQQGKLKHIRGDVINYFKAGDSFIESNKGAEHYVESIGRKNAILFVGVSTIKGLPTTLNK